MEEEKYIMEEIKQIRNPELSLLSRDRSAQYILQDLAKKSSKKKIIQI